MEPRTLKYLKEDPINMKHCNWVVSCLDLKQEAIKWVKKIDMDPKNKDILYRGLSDAQIQFITIFFNLTKEDLK